MRREGDWVVIEVMKRWVVGVVEKVGEDEVERGELEASKASRGQRGGSRSWWHWQ